MSVLPCGAFDIFRGFAHGLKDSGASKAELAAVAAAITRSALSLSGYEPKPQCGNEEPTVLMEVPVKLAANMHAQLESLQTHSENNDVSGKAHHLAAHAAIASGPLLGDAHVKESLKIKRRADRLRHFQQPCGRRWREVQHVEEARLACGTSASAVEAPSRETEIKGEFERIQTKREVNPVDEGKDEDKHICVDGATYSAVNTDTPQDQSGKHLEVGNDSHRPTDWRTLSPASLQAIYSKFPPSCDRSVVVGARHDRVLQDRWLRSPCSLADGMQVLVHYGLRREIGKILRRGYDRFADEYRVQFPWYNGRRNCDCWVPRWRCVHFSGGDAPIPEEWC